MPSYVPGCSACCSSLCASRAALAARAKSSQKRGISFGSLQLCSNQDKLKSATERKWNSTCVIQRCLVCLSRLFFCSNEPPQPVCFDPDNCHNPLGCEWSKANHLLSWNRAACGPLPLSVHIPAVRKPRTRSNLCVNLSQIQALRISSV